MVFSNNLLLGAVSAAAEYLIEQSLLFDGTSAYLTRTPSTAGNRKTWTFSCWVKTADLGTQRIILEGGVAGTSETSLFFGGGNTLEYFQRTSGATDVYLVSSPLFRDSSSWMHLAVVHDSTDATAADRVKLYVNGVRITDFSTETTAALNLDSYINSTDAHFIGAQSAAALVNYAGLMALPILVDGAALDATSFGELDADGYWNPIAFVGDYNVLGSTPTVSSASALWTGNTATWTFTADDISAPTGTDAAVRIMDYAFSDDFSVQWTHRATASSSYTIGVYPTASDASFNAATYYAGVFYSVGIATSFSVRFDSETTYSLWGGTSAEQSSLAVADNDVMKFERVGSTFKVYKNAALIRTMTFTSTSQMRIALGRGAACDMENVTFDYEIVDGVNGGAYDFADSSHFGNDVSGAGVTPDLTVATSWSGTNLAQYGFSAGNITKNTLSQNAIRTVGVWGGDFSITLDLLDGDGTFGTNEQFFGFASASDTFDDTKTAPTITGTNYYIQPATDSATLMTYYRNGAAVSTFAVVPGDTIKWERSGTTVTLYVNTVSRFSETTSLTGLVYGFIQLYKTNESADNVTTTGTFSNSFIDSGFATTDQLADTPTDSADDEIGNFATWNPNDGDPVGQFTPSEGNTVATFVTGSCEVFGSLAVTSGKYWFEITLLAKNASSNTYCGIQNTAESNSVWYRMDGAAFDGTTSSSAGTYATFTTSDRIGIALDLDAGTPTCAFYKNGSLIFTASAFSGAQVWRPFCYCDLSSTSWKLDAGQFGFVDTPPSGFKALATQNLPAPTIADGSQYFNTVLYTGNGATQSITGVGFQPDLLWIKSRTQARFHNLCDVIRGPGTSLFSNSTLADALNATLDSFDVDGFSLDGSGTGQNENTENYVAWCWKAGGAASSNTDGSITSSVSANTTAGFSIVSYTGTNAIATVGHGLASVPNMIIAKNRDSATDWYVYHSSNTSAPETDYLILNTTAATADGASVWNDTLPTSSVFSLGANGGVNGSSANQIAYCWAEVEGFSKFGSYVGNGSANGPFVYTGFKPAFVIIKKSSAAGTNWNMFDNKRDPFNLVIQALWANALDAEYTYTAGVDFLSNGFRIVGNPSQLNASAETHIYAVFAEHPFQGDEGYTQARAR
jgi:hypothetical protein